LKQLPLLAACVGVNHAIRLFQLGLGFQLSKAPKCFIYSYTTYSL
jgi:hypothetical protein